MRFVRFASVALLAGITFVLLDCSFLIKTPEYSIELAVERPAYKSADAQAVRVTYCVRSTEEEALRARYELTGVDGSLLDSGVISGLVLGVEQNRVIDLTGYPVFIDQGFVEEGLYRFRLVGQTKKADGSYQDLAFLDQTVEFFVDDTPPADPVFSHATGMYVGDQSVTIDHPEWAISDPSASPVMVYYTTDGSSPDTLSVPYSGPITFPTNRLPRVLRAIAIDAADNSNGSPVQIQLKFMKIHHVEIDDVPVVSISKSGGNEFLEVFGYGLYNYEMTGGLIDKDGTEATLFGAVDYSLDPTDEIDSKVTLAIDPSMGSGGSNGVIDSGPATIYLTNQSYPSNPTDSIPFTIVD